jgi:hypothetical protein
MSGFVKFCGSDLDPTREFAFPDVYELERGTAWQRLRIGLRHGEVERMVELCSELPGPFGVLYVLVVSRLGRDQGRYQSSRPVEFDDLAEFLRRYRDFIEQDGRHHIWVSDVADEGQLIFDRHNIIYAYGPLDRFKARLRARGVTEGTVRIPTPHGHEYHAEFDVLEDEMMSYWDWRYFPLGPGDDE